MVIKRPGKKLLTMMVMSMILIFGVSSVHAEETATKTTTGTTTTTTAKPDSTTEKQEPVLGWNGTAPQLTYYVQGETGLTQLKGLRKIGKNYYYFSPETGEVQTGLIKVGAKYYYFKAKGAAGEYGSAYLNKWKKVSGKYYWFNKKGKSVVNKWIGNYYVGPFGYRLVNGITPDGWITSSNGKKTVKIKANTFKKIDGSYYYYKSGTGLLKNKWLTTNGKKYYFDEDGKRVTGWQTIGKYTYFFSKKGVMKTGIAKVSGKQYYFNKKGRLQKNKTFTLEGKTYATDENGIVTETEATASTVSESDAKPKILVVSGHGQGDSGAVSTLGTESLKTREFAKLIVGYLKADKNIDTEWYKEGSISYDMYQQNKATFGSAGMNISNSITGAGKSSVIKNLKAGFAKNKNLPDLTAYDYVLEVHFNATAAASKDISGNGSIKGIGFYINNRKTNYKLEQKILAAVKSKTGMPIWGSGVYGSSGLFNARICQEVGTSYGLIETAFIDDKDDMTFYNKNKAKMAKAIADTIINYFSA